MHPILARRQRLGAYLAAWAPLAAALTYLLHAGSRMTWPEAAGFAVPMALVYAFQTLASWYVCRAVPPARTPVGRLALTHGLAAVVSSVVWVGGAATVVSLLCDKPGSERLLLEFNSSIPTLLVFGILGHVLITALHNVLLLFESGQEAERRGVELKMLAREAELKALQAQLDPHFLFNALNSVAALTTIDPARARTMSVLLADFLRRSLRLSEKASQPLSDELALARAFLAIEQVRFGKRLEVEERVEPGAGETPVPPLLLQPLIENAVRHGIGTLVDGGCVTVEARRGGGTLLLAVENPFDAEAGSERGEGVGLANVSRRLKARYGDNASLRTTMSEGRFRAEVTIALEPAA